MTNIARRTGLITTKVGMTQIFTTDGNSIPVTVLHVDRILFYKQKMKEATKQYTLDMGLLKILKSLRLDLQRRSE